MGWLEAATNCVDNLPFWGKAALAGSITLGVVAHLRWVLSVPSGRKTLLKKDFQQGTVYLYQLPRMMKYIPSASLTTLKVETWLRMAEIHYENSPLNFYTALAEGIIVFAECSGKVISGISMIRDLSLAVGNVQLEDHLSAEQSAAGHAFEILAEQSLYKSHMTELLTNVQQIDKVFEHTHIDGFLPRLYFKFHWQDILNQEHIGVPTNMKDREQQLDAGIEDLRALSKYLGAKHYFTGFKPTKIDATLFGVLAQIVYSPYKSIYSDLIESECTNLFDYVERIKHRYWPDWEDITAKFSLDSNWKKRPRRESKAPG